MFVEFTHMLNYKDFLECIKDVLENKIAGKSFELPKNQMEADKVSSRYICYADRNGLEYEFNGNIMFIRKPYRVIIQNYYNNQYSTTSERNRMGCSEDWYDCYYAVTQTLTPDEVKEMSDVDLDKLIRVVSTVQEYLY